MNRKKVFFSKIFSSNLTATFLEAEEEAEVEQEEESVEENKDEEVEVAKDESKSTESVQVLSTKTAITSHIHTIVSFQTAHDKPYKPSLF